MDDFDELAHAALALLEQAGPLSTEEWADLMVEQGHGDEDDMIELVDSIDSPMLGFFDDDRNVHVGALFEGRTLTHRVTEAEIASDIVEIGSDFSALTTLLDDDVRSNGVATVFRGLTPDAVFDVRGVDDPQWPEEGLMLPLGTLSGYSPGDLLGISIGICGAVFDRITQPLAPADTRDRLRDIVADDDHNFVDSVIWQLMYEDRSLFTVPTRPMSELFEEAELEHHIDHVARRGFDFDVARKVQSINMLSNAFELDSDEAAAVDLLLDLLRDAAEGDGESGRREWLESEVARAKELWLPLADPHTVSTAFNIIIRGDSGPGPLLLVTDVLLAHGPRRTHSAVRWLRAKALDLAGDAHEAERELERALDVDSQFEPALVDLAGFASLRGDAVRGLALLDRLDVEAGGHLREALEEFVPQEHPELGRNDRCWCGSGRKYKVCHLGRADFPLESRVSWLYSKIVDGSPYGRGAKLIPELARVRSEFWDDSDAQRTALLEDPFIVDVALFEGGLFAEFMKSRGSLLPDDELNLAQQWLLIGRSVFEVESVKPGEGLFLRDVRTGDRPFVSERSGSTQLQPGQFICVRVVPVGSELQIFGGIEPVYPTQRTELVDILDADPPRPVELVELLSRRFAPPRIQTREGDPVTFCEATFELGELGGIKRKLSRRYGAAKGSTWNWTEDSSAYGTLSLDGTVLTVEAMSEPRFDAMVDAVHTMHPTATVISEKYTPAAEAVSSRSGESPKAADVEHDPEILAILDARIREHEASWIHENIPALDGYTPTEAAADPTRRDDLIRLLDSFPDTGRPGAMSPSRLRKALGIDDGSAFWRAQR